MVFLFSVQSSFAASDDVVGVIMSFDCPHCKAVFERRDLLERACSLKSPDPCNVRYLPFVGSKVDQRAALFYELEKIDPKNAIAFAEAVYALKVGQEHSVEELAMIVSPYLSIDILSVATNLDRDESRVRLSKVANLITTLKISEYPEFVSVKRESIDIFPTVLDPAGRLESAIKHIQGGLK